MGGAYDLNGFGRGDQIQQRIAALEAERDGLRGRLERCKVECDGLGRALDIVRQSESELRAEVERLSGALREEQRAPHVGCLVLIPGIVIGYGVLWGACWIIAQIVNWLWP